MVVKLFGVQETDFAGRNSANRGKTPGGLQSYPSRCSLCSDVNTRVACDTCLHVICFGRTIRDADGNIVHVDGCISEEELDAAYGPSDEFLCPTCCKRTRGYEAGLKVPLHNPTGWAMAMSVGLAPLMLVQFSVDSPDAGNRDLLMEMELRQHFETINLSQSMIRERVVVSDDNTISSQVGNRLNRTATDFVTRHPAARLLVTIDVAPELDFFPPTEKLPHIGPLAFLHSIGLLGAKFGSSMRGMIIYASDIPRTVTAIPKTYGQIIDGSSFSWIMGFQWPQFRASTVAAATALFASDIFVHGLPVARAHLEAFGSRLLFRNHGAFLIEPFVSSNLLVNFWGPDATVPIKCAACQAHLQLTLKQPKNLDFLRLACKPCGKGLRVLAKEAFHGLAGGKGWLEHQYLLPYPPVEAPAPNTVATTKITDVDQPQDTTTISKVDVGGTQDNMSAEASVLGAKRKPPLTVRAKKRAKRSKFI